MWLLGWLGPPLGYFLTGRYLPVLACSAVRDGPGPECSGLRPSGCGLVGLHSTEDRLPRCLQSKIVEYTLKQYAFSNQVF